MTSKREFCHLPSIFPYASGHGPLMTAPSTTEDGQVPSLYIILKTLNIGVRYRNVAVKEDTCSHSSGQR